MREYYLYSSIEFRKFIPSTVPRNPLQLVSWKIIFNLVPLRILESLLTSSMAAKTAGFADLPITESKVNSAPMFTTLGLEEETEVEFPVLPITSKETHKLKINENIILFTNPWSGLVIKKTFFISKTAGMNLPTLLLDQLTQA